MLIGSHKGTCTATAAVAGAVTFIVTLTAAVTLIVALVVIKLHRVTVTMRAMPEVTIKVAIRVRLLQWSQSR